MKNLDAVPGITLAVNGEQPLDTLLRQAGITLAMPCGGNQSCGKCKIRVVGECAPITPAERRFLSEGEIRAGIRLACFTRVRGEAVTVYPPESRVTTLSAVVLPPHRCSHSGSALAVDIGTTTVAVQLYRRETGRVLGEALAANRQGSCGADVISRIEYSNRGGLPQLQDTIHRQLRDMAQACLEQGGLDQVDDIVVTGNTTMLHLWEGLDPRGIAVAPFVPASLFGGRSRHSLCEVHPYLPPCTGAYIGADITCAILSSGMLQRPEETALLVDLGTNGEIVLFESGRMLCASTAMGPAFEGANLSFGMAAAPGAITAVKVNAEGEIKASVFSGSRALGICGSGVLDAVRVLLELGYLDEMGLLADTGSGFTTWQGKPAWQIPGTQVLITQQDIRQIQLAKAAACAGIQTLLDEAGLAPEAIDRFYIAGGFGHYLDLGSAARIGLFPEELQARAGVLGNAALAGAVLLLLDAEAAPRLEWIKSHAKEIPLSGNSAFFDHYIENMLFEKI